MAETGRKRDPVKTIHRLDVVHIEDGLRIEVQGSGFLYKMVRHLAGALVGVGEHKITLEAVQKQLAMGSSQPAGNHGQYRGYNVLPAKGLFLHKVEYPPEVDDPSVLLYPELPHDEYGRLLDWLPGYSTAAEE